MKILRAFVFNKLKMKKNMTHKPKSLKRVTKTKISDVPVVDAYDSCDSCDPCAIAVGFAEELLVHTIAKKYNLAGARSQIQGVVKAVGVISVAGFALIFARKLVNPISAVSVSTSAGYLSYLLFERGEKLCVPGNKYFLHRLIFIEVDILNINF